MKVSLLRKSIDRIQNSQEKELSLQSVTYLATYPVILEAVKSFHRDQGSLLHTVATLAYGWMPRVARLDPLYLGLASKALIELAGEQGMGLNLSRVLDVQNCLHSLVGATKVFHFVRPDLYPIWDSKVATQWLGRPIEAKEMYDLSLYEKYFNDVHNTIEVQEFSGFYEDFELAYRSRLTSLRIPEYKISCVRAVEASLFELSS